MKTAVDHNKLRWFSKKQQKLDLVSFLHVMWSR